MTPFSAQPVTSLSGSSQVRAVPEDRAPRVAMFVLNPCHNDARVRKEASSLAAAGFEVRIFALGNRQWPEELVAEDGFTIQRVEVVSVYQRSLAQLASVYRWLAVGRRGRPGTVVPDQDLARTADRSWRPLARALAGLLLAPAGIVVWLARRILDVVARAGEGRPSVGDEAVVVVDKWGRYGDVARRALRGSRRFGRVVRTRGRRTLRRFARLRRLVRVRGRRTFRRARRLGRLVRARGRRSSRRGLRSLYLRLNRVLRRVLIRLHRPSVMIQFWRSSAAFAVAWGPDIAHGHDLNALPAAERVARATGARLVYDSHELWRRRNRSGELRPLARLVDVCQEWRLIRRADLVITVSENIGSWLQRTYRLTERPMILRNLPTRVEQRQGPSLRALAGLTDERILLYTGRITSGRGIEDALAALRHLPSDVMFVMLGYGDEEYARSLNGVIDRHGVGDRVRKVPAVAPHEVSAVAAQATMALVAIQPLCLSYRFALPNKLFEAIQAGVPVLASDLPDMAAVVERYGCGELFPPDDPAALVVAAHKILADPNPYRRAATAAAAELHWATESGLLTAAYRDLVARPVAT